MNVHKTAVIRALPARAMLFTLFTLSAFFVLFFLLPAPFSACEAASKKSGPEFQQSGSISGTQLQYQNLAVNQHGIAVVTIYNPTTTGVSFSANFSFYDSKGKYLGGLTVSGFAARNTRTAHAEKVDYNLIRKAASVKVLGRAGRKTE